MKLLPFLFNFTLPGDKPGSAGRNQTVETETAEREADVIEKDIRHYRNRASGVIPAKPSLYPF